MAEGPETEAAKLDDASWSRLADVVRRFDASWQTAPATELAQFVPDLGDPLRQPVLIELIKVDQERRWRRGEPRSLEEYLSQWPELAGKPDLLTELLWAECLTRAILDALPSSEELQGRFPQIWDRIDLAEIRAEAENDPPPVSGAGEPGEISDQASPGGSPCDVPSGVLKGGDRLGRYAIRGALGRGAMGAVYRAFDTQLQRDVALKIPDLDPDDEPEVLQRFLREAPAAAKIRHPNICPIFDAGRIDDQYYLTMALIEGQSLADWMKGRTVHPREAAELVRKLARALETVHAAGVIHRDLKASNVMIDRSGEPLLMDFGLARQAEADDPIAANESFLGTPAYMSPEQVNREPADARSDIYGLGVLLYQLLTGRLPFSGPLTQVLASIKHSEPPSPRLLNPDLDARLEAICLKAMAKRPADRYQSAAELAEALQGYLQATSEAARLSSQRRRLTWIVSAGVIALVLAGVVYSIPWRRDREQPEVKLQPIRQGNAVVENERPDGPIERWIEALPRIAGIQVSSDGSTLYAAYTEHPLRSRVQAFEVATGRLLRTIHFPDESYDHKGLALSRDGRYVYVSNYFRSDISRIDLRHQNTRSDLPVGERWGYSLGISPDQRTLVAALGEDGRSKDEGNDQIAIVDVADDKFSLVAQVKLNDEPWGSKIAFSADSRFAYLVTRQRKSTAPMLCEVRLTPPYEVARKLAFPEGQLDGIAVFVALNRAFVSDSVQRKIWAVDLESFRPIGGMELDGYAPGVLAIGDSATTPLSRSGRGAGGEGTSLLSGPPSPKQDLLAVLCPQNRKLFCLDPAAGTILARVDGLREDPWDLAFSPDQRRLFVADGGSNGGIAVVHLNRLMPQYAVVFASNRAGESYQLYAMDRDGRNVCRLTRTRANDFSPRWSPDGRTIAFVSNRNGLPRIFLMKRGSDAALPLKDTDPPSDVWPVFAPLDWSPDGKEIAFVGAGHTAIRIVDVETGAVRTLLQGAVGDGYAHHCGISWNKADGTILFNSHHPGSAFHQDIFRADPKNGGITQVTDSRGKPWHSTAPAASPDGRKVAVACHANLELQPPGPIFLMNPDGTGLVPLPATGDTRNAIPRWSPDGKHLVYCAWDDKDFHHIRILAVDGGTPIPLTSGEWNDIQPDICLGPVPPPETETRDFPGLRAQ